MKNTCDACGGVIGRDCFNPVDCAQISLNNQEDLTYRLDLAVKELMDWKSKCEKSRAEMYEIREENAQLHVELAIAKGEIERLKSLLNI
jgi:predicted nuclease with TOPRIM domain